MEKNAQNPWDQLTSYPVKIMDHTHLRPNLDSVFVGSFNGTTTKEICCNRIGVGLADTNEVGKHIFQAKTTVKDVKEIIIGMFNQD